jgi:hypothetical protein
MKTIIIIVLVYLLSCIATYKFIQAIYSEGGRKYGQKPNNSDIFVTFCPVVNSVLTVVGWVFFSPYVEKEADTSKFFNIKN